jgi:uncharacterized heparinase superfamily protein
MIILDCGEIGPSYQPGHTHCDFLSYELMAAGRRLVVDTGVCEYEPGKMRAYVRSTKAHNTVSVDGAEQSEIWSEFRVARRAKKLGARINRQGNDVEFLGSYRGFYGVRGRIVHERTAKVSLDVSGSRIERLAIIDRLTGSGHHGAESYIHFHPAVTLRPVKSGEIDVLYANRVIATLRIPSGQDFLVGPGWYCPEFGVRLTNQVLVMRTRGKMPLALQYEFSFDIDLNH